MRIQETDSRRAAAFGERALGFADCGSAPAKGAYPAHVVGPWRAANGAMVHIRPIAQDDGRLIRDFVRALSFEARYFRFMSAVKELSARTVAQLARIDHRRNAALVAVASEADADRIVGVARYALDSNGESGEFAIVVADDWRRRGLGRRLTTLVIDTAVARGLKRIVGDVLSINTPMLAFVTALGFDAVASKVDPILRRVERRLDGKGM